MVESFGAELKLCLITVSHRRSFRVVCCYVGLIGQSPTAQLPGVKMVSVAGHW